MTEIVTGTDLIRETLRSRNRKYNLAARARDVGVSVGLLEAFAEGNADLPPETLQALAKVLFQHTEFDPATNCLRPAMREPARPFGKPPALEMALPKYQAGPAPMGPQPETPAAPKPKRGGWIGGWL